MSVSVSGVLSQVSDAISIFPVSAKQPAVVGKSKVVSQSAVGSVVKHRDLPLFFTLQKKIRRSQRVRSYSARNLRAELPSIASGAHFLRSCPEVAATYWTLVDQGL